MQSARILINILYLQCWERDFDDRAPFAIIHNLPEKSFSVVHYSANLTDYQTQEECKSKIEKAPMVLLAARVQIAR